ncbi:MAG: hypothetical protein P8O16_04810 [Algoriphagus sp.]|jgi:hypothetical protein|uniref:hypothetical protein n=1 Tax=Algoriphagus sp. TaxID=1872435 RepID=UPI0026145277|nr:hypothetical protein [Algoriphagus sp.]MDG1276579.1 hypothetical protein [Algoriphagus sp.]
MIFTKRQKLMLRLLFQSFSGVFIGGCFKIMDNPNSDLILGFAILFQLIAVVGLASNWSRKLTISESKA